MRNSLANVKMLLRNRLVFTLLEAASVQHGCRMIAVWRLSRLYSASATLPLRETRRIASAARHIPVTGKMTQFSISQPPLL